MFGLIDARWERRAIAGLSTQCPRVLCVSAGPEQRKANLLDEKGSTILKTMIELPLAFLIYSNLGAIRLPEYEAKDVILGMRNRSPVHPIWMVK